MPYKDILVHAESDKAGAVRLDVASRIAHAHAAHLAALHVSTPPNIPAIAGAGVPVGLMAWQEEFERKQDTAVRAAVDQARTRNGVEFEWRAETGDLRSAALLHSRYADLVIVGQSSHADENPREADILPEVMVFGSGRPVLVVPRFGTFPTVGERVLLAWKRTRESARAVHDALPLLQQAKSVVVMEVNPDGGTVHMAGADIAGHLARHGVKTEVSTTVAGDIDAGNAILSRAADLGADFLVMGAYGHSRLREFVFGGVTREVLRHMTVPVLMSH